MVEHTPHYQSDERVMSSKPACFFYSQFFHHDLHDEKRFKLTLDFIMTNCQATIGVKKQRKPEEPIYLFRSQR